MNTYELAGNIVIAMLNNNKLHSVNDVTEAFTQIHKTILEQ